MSAEQKVTVSTGASQSIGATLVQAYHDRNYRVVAISRSIQPADDDDIVVVSGDIAERNSKRGTY